MKFAVLFGLLMACSGSAPSIMPQQTSETDIAVVSKSEPTCRNVELLSVNKPMCAFEGSAIPPGFWCASFLYDAKGSPLTVCYSAEATCTKMRKDGVDIGAQVGECQTRETAYCFTMTDAPKQRVHWRCYDSIKDCGILQKKAMGQHPNLLFRRCGLMNPTRASNGELRAALRSDDER